MIPVNQLRVGNWVTDDRGKPFQVTIDNLKWHHTFEPIKLSPEKLEKAGFELITWNGVIRHYFIPVTENKRCALSFKFGEFKGFPDRLDTVSIGSMPDESGNTYGRLPIQYVHQLQNLIHDLTGTELDINL